VWEPLSAVTGWVLTQAWEWGTRLLGVHLYESKHRNCPTHTHIPRQGRAICVLNPNLLILFRNSELWRWWFCKDMTQKCSIDLKGAFPTTVTIYPSHLDTAIIRCTSYGEAGSCLVTSNHQAWITSPHHLLILLVWHSFNMCNMVREMRGEQLFWLRMSFQAWWHMPVIPAIQEGMARGSWVWSQHRKVSDILSQKQKGWNCHSSGRVLA
jgi:hypothetical protein